MTAGWSLSGNGLRIFSTISLLRPATEKCFESSRRSRLWARYRPMSTQTGQALKRRSSVIRSHPR